MYNLCNAGDHITDFRVLIFRMTWCRWKFEFKFNFFLWNKGKVCCVQSSGHECYPFCLSKKKCGIWPGRWGLGFCSVDSPQGGLSLSCPCGVLWAGIPLPLAQTWWLLWVWAGSPVPPSDAFLDSSSPVTPLLLKLLASGHQWCLNVGNFWHKKMQFVWGLVGFVLSALCK